MFKKPLLALATAALFLPLVVVADTAAPKAVTEQLAKIVPGAEPSSVIETPIAGMYEVAFGTQILYMSADGKFLLEGDLIDIENRKNLTSLTQNKARKEIVSGIKDEDTILFAGDKDKTNHTVTIFTDIDCPYCRKLHHEMQAYNDAGIAVRYMLYPRAGVGSPAYKKAVDVWCSKDSKAAMTAAKSDKFVESADKDCANPVQDHMAIGQQLGVSGTPAIVLESGDLIPGYRPAAMLAQDLKSLAAK